MNLENVCDDTLRINSGNPDLYNRRLSDESQDPKTGSDGSCNKKSELVFSSRSQIKNKSPHTFPKSNNDCSSNNITQNKIIKLSKYSRSLSYN
jgi:hypothetical protein